MKNRLLTLTLITSHHLILAQEKPSNFKEQLKLGETLSLSSDEKQNEAVSSAANNPSSMEQFLKHGLKYLAEKNKIKKTIKIKSESNPLPYLSTEDNEIQQKISFTEFQKCAAKSLPIVKHLLGKTILSSNPAEIDEDYYNLSEFSKKLFSELKLGQLICGPFLGNKIFPYNSVERDPVQFLSNQAIFLSIVSRLKDPHSFSTAWIMTSFSQGFYTKTPNTEFWKSYWKYLSLEILIKNNFYFISPEEFSLKNLNKEWDKSKRMKIEETHTALKEI
jgi:hypothetical protein